MQHAVAARALTLSLPPHPGNQEIYAAGRNSALTPPDVPASEPVPTLSVEEWDELFQAVIERLSLAVQSPHSDSAMTPAPHPHDIVSSVQTAVNECVGELRMLGRVVREERACSSREFEPARA